MNTGDNPDWPFDNSSLLRERGVMQWWQLGWSEVSKDGIWSQAPSFTTDEIFPYLYNGVIATRVQASYEIKWDDTSNLTCSAITTADKMI